MGLSMKSLPASRNETLSQQLSTSPELPSLEAVTAPGHSQGGVFIRVPVPLG